MHLEVLIENPRGAERRQLRVDGAVSIGRGEGCTLRIDSHLVSRHHATLHLASGERMRVVDSSRNGTLAGSVLLKQAEAEVPLATRLTVGDCTLELQRPGAAPRVEAGVAPGAAAQATLGDPGAAPPTPPARSSVRPASGSGAALSERSDPVELRREIHRLLLEHLDLAAIDAKKPKDPE